MRNIEIEIYHLALYAKQSRDTGKNYQT